MATDDNAPEVEISESSEDEAPDNDILTASDEDFLKMSFEDLQDNINEESTADNDSDDDNYDNNSDDDDDSDDGEIDETEAAEETAEPDAEENEDSEDDDESEETEEAEETDDDSDEEEDTPDDVKGTDAAYAAEYRKLLAPFKANGMQMQVRSADEALTLMKMGANYHKKMAGLKPSLRVVKLLDKHNLLDPDKISYLIDLHSKDPQAITQLVKDSGIDPLDMDVTTETDYKPVNRAVTDTEVELDNVLESIKDTPTYSKTINVITENWDNTSRELIAKAPHIIELINDHMADGTYEAIATVVNRERTLGRLTGVSDLEAYKQVGDILHANHQLPGQTPPAATNKRTGKKHTAAEEKQRKAQKKKVSSTKKSKSTSVVRANFNPLALSDEEFAKLADSQFK